MIPTLSPPEPLLIVCGGSSSRMGSPKPLLRWQEHTLIARQVADALPHRPVWLAAGGQHYADTEGAGYLPDALPQAGPLGAILPALEQAGELGYSGLYVLSCDTLLLPEQLIGRLNQAADSDIWPNGLTALADADNPDHLHPLLAHWPTGAAAAIRHYLADGGRRVMHSIADLPRQTVALPQTWQHLSNFNTPAEFERAQTEYTQLCHSAI